jgi:LacI family repressor for deo operon, udp, cdd, tsx, nupC, and nupG
MAGPGAEGGAGRGPTVQDVAARAHVSAATVSRALRDVPNVAPETRARVREVAEELGYRPDPHASRLAAGRTMTVGVAVPDIAGWYFAETLAGVEAGLQEAGYDLLLTAVHTDEERHAVVTHQILRKRVDGLVLVELRLLPDEAEQLARTGTGLVTIGDRHAWFPSVSIDNRAAAEAAVSHLLRLGHERIALLGEDPSPPHPFLVPGQRRQGYVDALGGAMAAVEPAYDVPGGFTVDGGRRATDRLLSLARPPTAIFAMSDEMAFGALRAVHDRGGRVPEDVSVVGFDDHALAASFDLTTVRQVPRELGTLAAATLVGCIASPTVRHPDIVAPVELVVRGSTGRASH